MATMNTMIIGNSGTAITATSSGVERGAPVPDGVGLTADGEGCVTSVRNKRKEHTIFVATHKN